MGDTVRATEIYHVAPGYESDFYSWGNEVLQELARSSSFLGGRVLEPDHEGGDWELEHRWADPDVAARWLESAARAELLAAAADFAQPREAPQRPREAPQRPREAPQRARETPQRAREAPQRPPAPAPVAWSALEPGWDDPPPPPPPPQPPPTTTPPKWKTAVVMLVAVFPPALFFNVTLIPRLGGVNVVIRTLVFCVGFTAAVTWVMMPRLMPLFKGWLNSGQGERRGVPMRATIDGRVHADAELPARRPAALGTAPVDTALPGSADSFPDRWDPDPDQYRSRAGRAGYLHQPSPNRRDPR